MDDFALVLVTAIDPGPRKHIDLPESIFIAASKDGVGELQVDEWRKSSLRVKPCPTSGLTDLSECPAPTQGQPAFGADTGSGGDSDVPHPKYLVPWGLLACFGELPRNQGNPRLIFPSGSPSLPEFTFCESPSGVGRQCEQGRQAFCSNPRSQRSGHLPTHTGHLRGHLSRLWASSCHIGQVSKASTLQSSPYRSRRLRLSRGLLHGLPWSLESSEPGQYGGKLPEAMRSWCLFHNRLGTSQAALIWSICQFPGCQRAPH